MLLEFVSSLVRLENGKSGDAPLKRSPNEKSTINKQIPAVFTFFVELVNFALGLFATIFTKAGECFMMLCKYKTSSSNLH